MAVEACFGARLRTGSAARYAHVPDGWGVQAGRMAGVSGILGWCKPGARPSGPTVGRRVYIYICTVLHLFVFLLLRAFTLAGLDVVTGCDLVLLRAPTS
jgi:hypothetical protein